MLAKKKFFLKNIFQTKQNKKTFFFVGLICLNTFKEFNR